MVFGPLDNNWANFRKYQWVIWGPPKEFLLPQPLKSAFELADKNSFYLNLGYQ